MTFPPLLTAIKAYTSSSPAAKKHPAQKTHFHATLRLFGEPWLSGTHHQPRKKDANKLRVETRRQILLCAIVVSKRTQLSFRLLSNYPHVYISKCEGGLFRRPRRSTVEIHPMSRDERLFKTTDDWHVWCVTYDAYITWRTQFGGPFRAG